MEEEIQVPVYFLTGFLESGKTSFLKFTMSQEYFKIDAKTLLILCEEGEEEYEKELLKSTNTILTVIDEEEEFTESRLQELENQYKPARVMIEYNGMWRASRFHEMKLPEGWGVMQEITTVDASTFPVYMNNMKSLFMEIVRNTEMIVFNRCKKGDPLAAFRRGIKVVNQAAEIIFEDENGEIDNIFEEEMPYDMEAPIIDIAPEDYGLWYMDVMDHPKKYNKKSVRFKARVRKARRANSIYFMPVRTAMTCCADDTSAIGYPCKSKLSPTLMAGEWVEVTATIALYGDPDSEDVEIVLEAKSVCSCEPLADEMVYFN